MATKLIFLDIDGVLNSEVFFVEKRTKGSHEMIDKDCISLLNQLEGAAVVVTSSWGENNGKTTEDLNAAGLKLPILGYTTKLHYEFEWACRGNEIEKWLRRTYGGMGTMFGHEYESAIYDYVIFDDDADMLLGQANHFIRVNRYTGLTQEDIDKARKILGIQKTPILNYTYWIDDQRNPKDFLPEDEYKSALWIRNYDSFKMVLEDMGVPKKIYFDHDLGYGKSGYDCAKLLVEFCEEHNCALPEYDSQSNNPPGKENILKYLDSYVKSKKI